MGTIDLIIYGFILLLVFIGFARGFIKQVLSIANWLLSLIAAFAFVGPFSKLMMKTSLQVTINDKVGAWIASKGNIFTIAYDPANGNQQISEAISEGLKLPKFIADAIANGIKFDVKSGTTLADILSPSIGSIIMTAISFIILFIGSMIIIKIIINLLHIIFDKGVAGLINRILGAVLGLVKGIIIVSLVMLLVSVLSGVIPSLNEFLIKDLKLNEETFSIGKYFYQHNPIVELIKGSFSFDKILESIKA